MIWDDDWYRMDETDGDYVMDFVRFLAKLDLAENGMYDMQVYEVMPKHMLRFSVHSK